jgi:hypothetical protein
MDLPAGREVEREIFKIGIFAIPALGKSHPGVRGTVIPALGKSHLGVRGTVIPALGDSHPGVNIAGIQKEKNPKYAPIPGCRLRTRRHDEKKWMPAEGTPA